MIIGGQVRRFRAIALAAICLLLFTGVAISSVAIWASANVIPSTPSVVKDTHEVFDVDDHDADDAGGSALVDGDNDD